MTTPTNDAAQFLMTWLQSAQKQFVDWQQDYVRQMSEAWSAAAGAATQSQPAAGAAATDKRFANEAWTSDPRFDAIKRSYLAYANILQNSVEAAQVDERTKGQLRFGVRQYVDAMSPGNFFVTNPEAIELAKETGGSSITEGMSLFLQDLAKGRISMTDESAFEVGKSLAVSPGAVVFENELIQLIQYSPATPQVYERPLVMVPPAINKFYILDLQPENSFVRHAVDQGHTVFMVSWRNIKPALGHISWDDYLESGVMKAIAVAREITRADKVNTLGFCVGGTLLACAGAVMGTRGEETIASMTLLTTMLDFSDPGEIGLLISEQSVAAREATVGRNGVLEGKELSAVFSSLRANDLIWQYVVNSYLKGKGPPAFDLLYWNSDATNLPGPMFCWYVRNAYLENNLCVSGKTVQCGVPVDLSLIDVPVYLYASREDHIVPWRTAYQSTHLLPNDTTFVLGASGHIAGVINPPAKNKRNYWTGDPTADAEQWLNAAQKVAGSWWPHWSAWLAQQTGTQAAAPSAPGNAQYRPIEPAPGRYVKEKA
jgi:polyhydroxyalkanoate synthase